MKADILNANDNKRRVLERNTAKTKSLHAGDTAPMRAGHLYLIEIAAVAAHTVRTNR